MLSIDPNLAYGSDPERRQTNTLCAADFLPYEVLAQINRNRAAVQPSEFDAAVEAEHALAVNY
ncbi:hypothetical protein JW968_02440 [Candidatus Woesearchaeota archaeon]|nr:hypothetical protein [Candidatus Woesearchaeota archaeon]